MSTIAVSFEVLNTKNTPSIAADVAANRPATAAIGALYISTDTNTLERWNGSAWVAIGGGGGGIGGSGTINTIPIFTAATDIGDSSITYTPGAIGLAPSYSLGSNKVLTLPFTNAAAQPIGLYIYEAVATGFNFQRVVGAPSYNSIYSGNSKLEFKLFDGSTDYYHTFFSNGRIAINGTTDTGYQLNVSGTSQFVGAMTVNGTITSNNTISSNSGTIRTALSYGATFGIVGTVTNHNLEFRANNTVGMLLVTGTNRLLVNTTTDAGAYALQVNGTTYTGGLYLNGGNLSFSSTTQDIGTSALGARNFYCGSIFPTTGNSWLFLGDTSNFGMHLRKSGSNLGNVYIYDSAGTTTSNTTLLMLHSTTRGMRLPSMTTAQRTAISSPINGLMVFDSDLSHICFYDTAGTPGWRKLSYSNA